MANSLTNLFKIPDLKKRLLLTLGMLAIYRVGVHIPVPGVNVNAIASFFRAHQGGLFGLVDLFSGGAFSRLSMFALGIMPYISAEIIFQLLTTAVPFFEKLSKEGEQGRKKLHQYARYFTVFLSVIQAYAFANFAHSIGPNVVLNWGAGFIFSTVLTMTTGTMFLMWMGEQITERGIGNGISLLIFLSVIARLPVAFKNTLSIVISGQLFPLRFLIALVIMILILAAVIFIEQGQRKIPIQYAKRMVGRKLMGGQSTFLPLRVDTSGVIAVIFASALISTPAILLSFIKSPAAQLIARLLTPGNVVYSISMAVLIIFFCYLYTAITFNPKDISDNLKKYGGFIPGIRAGKSTSEYIDRVLTRITLWGALFVAFISVIPYYLSRMTGVPQNLVQSFGGTSILIIVGVALDTLAQLESHLMMRHYEGFMKKGKIRGHRG